MYEIFILLTLFVLGIFSGFGAGVRFGFLDPDQDENDLEKTRIVKFYQNKPVRILNNTLLFPVSFCIVMFICLLVICFRPDIQIQTDFILRCFISMYAGQILAYVAGMMYNQKYLK